MSEVNTGPYCSLCNVNFESDFIHRLDACIMHTFYRVINSTNIGLPRPAHRSEQKYFLSHILTLFQVSKRNALVFGLTAKLFSNNILTLLFMTNIDVTYTRCVFH